MENTFQSHPKFRDLQAKGCQDDHAAEIATSVYINLCEKHKWWDLKLEYSESLSSPYITGRPTKIDECSTVIPCNVHQELSLDSIFKYFSLLDKNAPQTITMALCEADLTVVYYNFNMGLPATERLGRHGTGSRQLKSLVAKE